RTVEAIGILANSATDYGLHRNSGEFRYGLRAMNSISSNRRPFVAGNWKMFTTGATARQLARAVVKGLGSEDRVTVTGCPPFPYLATVAEVLRGSPVGLGAQNVYPEKEGAFTGEVSTTMLTDVGCRYVIVGHSERRHKLGETDAFINRKVYAALGAGLTV